MIEFMDMRRAPGPRTPNGDWSCGVPLGLFWTPAYAEIPLDGFGGASWELPNGVVPQEDAPYMLWVSSAGVPRRWLAVEVLDGDAPMISAPCDPEYVPQGLVATPGADLRRVRALLRGAALVARIHYTGPKLPGRSATVRPIILFTDGGK